MFEKTDINSRLKLIDFGFSKIWDPKQPKRMHATCGTLAYVSPDILLGGYTNVCDLWSLGVIGKERAESKSIVGSLLPIAGDLRFTLVQKMVYCVPKMVPCICFLDSVHAACWISSIFRNRRRNVFKNIRSTVFFIWGKVFLVYDDVLA